MPDKPGFFRRILGSPSDRSAELAARQGGELDAGVSTRASAVDADESLGMPVSSALLRLMLVVEEPLDTDRMRPLWNALSARFRRELRRDELVPSVDALRELMGDAFLGNVHQFEQFLSVLDDRLEASLHQLEASRDIGSRRAALSEGLSNDLQSRMDQMRITIDEASGLDQLKDNMRGGIDSISRALDEARSNERDLEQEFERHLEQLIARVAQLERESNSLELRLHEHRRMALTDTLTQLPNREALRERLEEEIERFSRYARPVTVAMCDVDYFKMVNDTFGHLGGDEVLRRVAQLVRERLRDIDMVARYGGEEFVIVMPETDTAQAVPVLDRLRALISETLISYEGKNVSVTVSLGVAQLAAGDAADRVIHRADAALYLAKNRGRNRVICYGDAE